MDISYQHCFDLKPEDLQLRILNCSKEKIQNNTNIRNIKLSELPSINFSNQSFDLALCGDMLFLNNEDLSLNFHLTTILELVRIATEVRIYPLTDKNGQPSNYLGPVLQALQQKGLGVELRQTPVKEGNAILKIWNESCVLNNNA